MEFSEWPRNYLQNSISIIRPPQMTPYYEDSAVKIFLGDCREILPHLGPVDLVLTDPQWGVGLTEKAHKDKTYFYGYAGYGFIEDSPDYVKEVLAL